MSKTDKRYKAIFFDWDGTAVKNRKEPADKVAELMKPLLGSGVKLIIISGTTYDKIADGRLHGYFTEKELDNLYLGLARWTICIWAWRGEHTTIRSKTGSRCSTESSCQRQRKS